MSFYVVHARNIWKDSYDIDTSPILGITQSLLTAKQLMNDYCQTQMNQFSHLKLQKNSIIDTIHNALLCLFLQDKMGYHQIAIYISMHTPI